MVGEKFLSPIESTRISVADDDDRSLPFDLQYYDPAGAEDYQDIFLFRAPIHPSIVKARRDAFHLDEQMVAAAWDGAHEGGKLFVSGFPNCLQGIDYDARVIHFARFQLAGHHVRNDQSSDLWIRRGRLLPDGRVPELGGLSGSPVFSEARDGSWGFAGIAITGSDQSRNFRFVDSHVLLRALRDAAKSPAWAG